MVCLDCGEGIQEPGQDVLIGFGLHTQQLGFFILRTHFHENLHDGTIFRIVHGNVLLHIFEGQTGVGLLAAALTGDNLHGVARVFHLGMHQSDVLIRTVTGGGLLKGLADFQGAHLAVDLDVLGGGVVGDLAGFAAATYLRGIPYIQMPTTLLAMVDSSVGGKTGIDLEQGKNLVGAFYQPTVVLCDTDTLDTLPENIFRVGCAEVIKYSILFDKELFAHLEDRGIAFDREAVIARCVELKKIAVEADEFDQGQRMLLNLGHTIGHAIEKYSNYTISHGQAVSIGMAIVCRSCECSDTNRILALLAKFDLPIATVYSAEDLEKSAVSDKKRSGKLVNLIIPGSIGNCAIVSTDTEKLKAFIEKGL